MLAAVMMSGALAQSGLAQPTNTDLQAAYCIAVLQGKIRVLTDLMGQPGASSYYTQWRNEAVATLHRVQGYLVPRMWSLAPLGLATALNQGTTDIQQAYADASRCADTACAAGPSDECARCGAASQPLKTTARCDSASFLPY